MSILDELGLAEADLSALMRDLPERSLYEQSLDEELREEEAAAERVRREPGSVARRKEIEARIAELRNPRTGGGRVSWEAILEKLGQEFDPAQVKAVLDLHRASVREGDGRSVTVREASAALRDELERWVIALRDPDTYGTLSREQAAKALGISVAEVERAYQRAVVQEADRESQQERAYQVVEALGLSGEEEADALLEELRG